jgi:hypothetical protein
MGNDTARVTFRLETMTSTTWNDLVLYGKKHGKVLSIVSTWQTLCLQLFRVTFVRVSWRLLDGAMAWV